jgi:hypothetical protein
MFDIMLLSTGPKTDFCNEGIYSKYLDTEKVFNLADMFSIPTAPVV